MYVRALTHTCRTVFQSFGEFYMDEMTNDWSVVIVIAIFLLMNIVLMNLLIGTRIGPQAVKSNKLEGLTRQASRGLTNLVACSYDGGNLRGRARKGGVRAHARTLQRHRGVFTFLCRLPSPHQYPGAALKLIYLDSLSLSLWGSEGSRKEGREGGRRERLNPSLPADWVGRERRWENTFDTGTGGSSSEFEGESVRFP